MYPVSEAFLQAVQENTRRYYWTGRITTTKGATYEFGADDIVKGSGYISSQCCGSTEIELGTVYAAEMGITLLSDIDRYTLEDALVELFYHLRLSDGTFEEVPMGIFEVSEANRNIKTLELKAHDYMLRFDKSFNGFETIGTVYDFVSLCCKACKVEMAQSQADYEAMPNGTELLSIYTENDIETYRDVLYYVGQVLGGFFCINREGKLELRKYGNEPVMELETKHRFTSSFSDFITRYTAVSSTNMKTETAEYYHLDPDDGLTMNLGVNPLLQFGLKETREQLCMNILNDLAVVDYVPFDSETIGNPALDLGDVIRFKGGQADENRISAITSMQCKIGGKHTLKGVGKNPRLAHAKSKNDKNISGLLNQIIDNKEAGKIGIHTFTNASSFTVGESDVKIISIEFAPNEAVMAQFFGSVIVGVNADQVERSVVARGDVVIPSVEVTEKVEEVLPEEENGTESEVAGSEDGGVATEDASEGDTSEEPKVIGKTKEQTLSVELPVVWKEDGQVVVHFTFEFNDNIIEIHQPEETWHSGKHSIMLYYPIENLVANYRNIFNVYARATGGTVTVDTGDCLAAIMGQSMGAGEAWDGEIKIEETIKKVKVGGVLQMAVVDENITWKIDELVKRTYSDVVHGRFGIGAFAMPVER
ncbi:hypothetical protein ACTNB0_00875 [Lachnospiraceae bacterium HCP28S3_F9]|nr:hypothetical protein [Lachnospiraceae bacterium]MDY4206013.1 hypothetical protein [Lachnospiraceae bacterium]